MDEKKEKNDRYKNLKSDIKKERSAMIAELSFIFLPFVVILIVNISEGDWIKIIQTSDWSLAATILFGQTIVKVVMGLASREESYHYQNFGLITALIIVLGLVPSIIVLILFEIQSSLSIGLVISQFMLLGLAITIFLIFGTIGQVLFMGAFRSKISKLLGLTRTETDKN